MQRAIFFTAFFLIQSCTQKSSQGTVNSLTKEEFDTLDTVSTLALDVNALQKSICKEAKVKVGQLPDSIDNCGAGDSSKGLNCRVVKSKSRLILSPKAIMNCYHIVKHKGESASSYPPPSTVVPAAKRQLPQTTGDKMECWHMPRVYQIEHAPQILKDCFKYPETYACLAPIENKAKGTITVPPCVSLYRSQEPLEKFGGGYAPKGSVVSGLAMACVMRKLEPELPADKDNCYSPGQVETAQEASGNKENVPVSDEGTEGMSNNEQNSSNSKDDLSDTPDSLF